MLPVTFALCRRALVTRRRPQAQAGRRRAARARALAPRTPPAALTVDHYDDDWSRLAWVQALGDVRIVEPQAAPAAIAALSERYEPYVDRPPAGPVLALEPERLLWWRA